MKIKKIIISLILVLIAFAIYKLIYENPRNWYDHFLYLAKSLLAGHVDVTNLPSFYQDVVTRNNKTYLPFPPAPALVIIPFLLAIPKITQQQISVFIGSLDIGLIFLLLSKFTTLRKAILISIFAGFGTVLFWSSVVGTTWYFAHITAFLFLSLSLFLHFSKKDFFAGLFFGLAVLCRYPIAVGGLFFLVSLIKDKKRLLWFLIGAAPVVPIQLAYNWVRFHTFVDLGYVEIYNSYVASSIPYNFLETINTSFHGFGYLDPRNIPLHLFTFLVMPPIIGTNFIPTPSPYGMGILFTSPLLLIALKPNFRDKLERNLFIGASSIALVDFLHFSQGWVQFGYRFAIDFLPFLLIILALRFRENTKNIILLLISIIVSTWGVFQGIKLGW